MIRVCLNDGVILNHSVICPYFRTDPFEEKLQRLKEAYTRGKTTTAKFSAEQLQRLGRFLQDNSKQLHDALDGDLGKVL